MRRFAFPTITEAIERTPPQNLNQRVGQNKQNTVIGQAGLFKKPIT